MFFITFLCKYRKGFITQYVLLTLTEERKISIDKKELNGTVLMDLAKALDTINKLLNAKLHGYGFSNKDFNLFIS